MSPLSLVNIWTNRNVDCCVNTVDKKVTTAKNLRLRYVVMATSFVARNGDKLAYPTFIVCANILQRMGNWEYRNAGSCVSINDYSSTSDKNFMNWSSTLRSCCAFAWVGWCTHGQNTHVSDVFIRVLGLIFAKRSGNIEGVNWLHNKRLWLRRLAQGTLLW